jgi:hypothetical protein
MKNLRKLVLGAAGGGIIALGSVLAVDAATIGPEPVPVVREYHPQQTAPSDDEGRPVEPMLLWSLAGIGASGVVLTVLYLLKRRVGGFPENPDWVAPITIMQSKDNATEETFGGVSAHDSHGSHH